jgi:pimeloyl-ACP methyl ester carboxylesterase
MPTPVEHLFRRWLHASGYVSREVQAPAGRVHYYDTEGGGGDGPFLVVLHGVSSGATLMAPILSRLAPRFERVVAIDMPGHGFSESPADLDLESFYSGVEHVLERVLDRPAVIFGHSLGGAVASRFAVDHPERVRGLVLLSPAGAPSPVDQRQAWLDQFAMKDHRAAMDFVRLLYLKPPIYLPVVARACRWLFQRESVRQLLRSAREDYSLTLEPAQIASIAAPIRFIWGGAERTMLPAHRAFWFEQLPSHAERVTPPHFTHCPYLEYVGEVADLITDFASAIPATAEAAA